MILDQLKGTVTISLDDARAIDNKIAKVEANQAHMKKVSELLQFFLQDIRNEKVVLEAAERFNAHADGEARINFSGKAVKIEIAP